MCPPLSLCSGSEVANIREKAKFTFPEDLHFWVIIYLHYWAIIDSVSCGRTFRHYPSGVTPKNQSQRTVVLAALMYGLGLSCSAASHLLGALGAEVSRMSVWRDAQEAGEALRRKRPAGRVRVLGADETVFKVKGEEVVVGFVVDGASGRTLGFEVLFEGDAGAFRRWLEPYARALGAEVLVSDDNDSYGVAARGLGLEHQLCMSVAKLTCASTWLGGRSRSTSKPRGSGREKKGRSSKSSRRT